MSYDITSRAYLHRAKERLEECTNESLFYAAFELRSGIEARMIEYLEVQEHISNKKRTGWQVAKLAQNIENVFRLGEQDAVLKVRDIETDNVVFEARYTPVKRSLRGKAEKLGNYLHNLKKYYANDSKYWTDLRKLITEGVTELERATSGRLLGPLLMHPNKKNVIMRLELPTPEEQEFAKKFKEQDKLIMEINYE